MSIKNLNDVGLPVCECGGETVQTIIGRTEKAKPFPSFTTSHLKNSNGQPLEITSLRQIRELERQHKATDLVWEIGSYNSEHYGEE